MNVSPIDNVSFFLECPLYIVPRRILCDLFLRNNYEFTVHVLLYGISDGINNFIINQATQEYVIATNRFKLLNNLSFNNVIPILDSVYICQRFNV